MAGYNKNWTPIEPGDLVSHISIPKTVGIFVEYIQFKKNFNPHTTVECMRIFWLMHPDIDQFGPYSIIPNKYIRHFKPWRGFHQKA